MGFNSAFKGLISLGIRMKCINYEMFIDLLLHPHCVPTCQAALYHPFAL